MLLRALIGVTLFSAAYMAEVVRGGLQAIDKGQYEGADAVGLSYWQSMRLIILPQALTHVIPGIVNTSLACLKTPRLSASLVFSTFLVRRNQRLPIQHGQRRFKASQVTLSWQPFSLSSVLACHVIQCIWNKNSAAAVIARPIELKGSQA